MQAGLCGNHFQSLKRKRPEFDTKIRPFASVFDHLENSVPINFAPLVKHNHDTNHLTWPNHPVVQSPDYPGILKLEHN